jgi:hypothetical protein
VADETDVVLRFDLRGVDALLGCKNQEEEEEEGRMMRSLPVNQLSGEGQGGGVKRGIPLLSRAAVTFWFASRMACVSASLNLFVPAEKQGGAEF